MKPVRSFITAWTAKCVILTACVYTVSYAANSLAGGYWLQPERDAHALPMTGLLTHNAILWQPRIGYCSCFRSDWVGKIYQPLICLDRKWLHPTKNVLDEADCAWLQNDLTESEVHPRFMRQYRGIKACN